MLGSPTELDGRSLVDIIRRTRLSKYNVASDQPLDISGQIGRRLLIVDQVAGDRSIFGAGATAATFERMARLAIDERSGWRLLLQVHPDVRSGLAKGILATRARDFGLEVIDDNIEPHAILDAVDEVWTVSSQLGLDAIIRAIPTTVFAAPFYAGWSAATERPLDELSRQAVSRRKGYQRSRPAGDLLAATLCANSIWFDPVLGRRISAEGALERLASWRDRIHERRGKFAVVGVRRWKRPAVAKALGFPLSDVRFVSARSAMRSPASIAIWGRGGHPSLEHRALLAQRNLITLEDGFLRSVGLGSDVIPPASLVADAVGIYFDASRPSKLEEILAKVEFDDPLLTRAANLRHKIVKLGLSKYNLVGGTNDLPEKFHLVIGQVADDASIRLGAIDVRSSDELVEEVRGRFPGATLVYKEHPDVIVGKRKGGLSLRSRSLVNALSPACDAVSLLSRTERIHTISSLAGFEAVMRGVAVSTYGLPFYAGWGLTDDRHRLRRRDRTLTVDALVAATLILYPRYTDPRSGIACEVEDVVELMARSARGEIARGGIVKRRDRLIRLARGVLESWQIGGFWPAGWL